MITRFVPSFRLSVLLTEVVSCWTSFIESLSAVLHKLPYLPFVPMLLLQTLIITCSIGSPLLWYILCRIRPRPLTAIQDCRRSAVHIGRNTAPFFCASHKINLC